MSRILARLLGRRNTGGEAAVAVRQLSGRSGRLMATITNRPRAVLRVGLPNASWAVLGGSAVDAPLLMRRAEVLNPTGGVLSFRLGRMAISGGTPTTAEAVLAWNTSVAAGEVWRWEGAMPFAGQYLFGYGSAGGLVFYSEWEEITP